ncbi:MAG: folate-binding protein YgfZ [Moraxellaceae bacterium]|nr:folate-binding protein YgfZ [Pseudomonadales bacterium]MCP5175455.1 folate-binding protein YgfZ [Moraxellaceae bacterium]MCP5176012.1 folate-binding protein YgfZ [Moraxellaceae bacterium]
MSTIIRLTDSILTIQGADAHKFLQGQTTTDFKEVTPEQSRLGGYANLKGRLAFSFRAIEWPAQQLNLVINQALLAIAKNTLQKYIVFSKAQISTPDTNVIGILGADSDKLLSELFGFCPTIINQTLSNEQISLTRVDGDSRWLLLVKSEFSETVWQQLSQQATIASINDWRLAQIAAGETPILAETTELYQPQELNYLALNAISYNKGCYTGQEIIARLYFRGKLKQWTHRFNVKLRELPALNTVIYDESGHSQGHVVLAAQADAQSVELLAIVRHDYADKVFLGDEKRPLELLPLPYVVEVKE